MSLNYSPIEDDAKEFWKFMKEKNPSNDEITHYFREYSAKHNLSPEDEKDYMAFCIMRDPDRKPIIYDYLLCETAMETL